MSNDPLSIGIGQSILLRIKTVCNDKIENKLCSIKCENELT